MFEKFTQLADTIEEMEARIRDMAKKELAPALEEAITELKVVFPEAKGILWNQYTPYFNDGDACVFHIHGVYLDPKENSNEDSGSLKDYYDYDMSYLDVDSFTEDQRATASQFSGAVYGCERALKIAFGDHVTVIVDFETGQVETEDKDHD